MICKAFLWVTSCPHQWTKRDRIRPQSVGSVWGRIRPKKVGKIHRIRPWHPTFPRSDLFLSDPTGLYGTFGFPSFLSSFTHKQSNHLKHCHALITKRHKDIRACLRWVQRTHIERDLACCWLIILLKPCLPQPCNYPSHS
jgi:hypothetical protein